MQCSVKLKVCHLNHYKRWFQISPLLQVREPDPDRPEGLCGIRAEGQGGDEVRRDDRRVGRAVERTQRHPLHRLHHDHCRLRKHLSEDRQRAGTKVIYKYKAVKTADLTAIQCVSINKI